MAQLNKDKTAALMEKCKTTWELAQKHGTMGKYGTAWVTSRPDFGRKRRSPATLMTGPILRTALRLRFNKPVCAVVPADPNPKLHACRLCGKALDNHGHHAQSCKHLNGWRTRRHNACRDALQEEARAIRKGDGSLLREVTVAEGLGLEIKPCARVGLTPAAQEARADLAIVRPAAPGVAASTWVIDITVTSTGATIPVSKLREQVVWPAQRVARRKSELRALLDSVDWASADGKHVLYHMLTALPWPARVAVAGGAGARGAGADAATPLSAWLGSVFDATVLERRFRRRLADGIIRWASHWTRVFAAERWRVLAEARALEAIASP